MLISMRREKIVTFTVLEMMNRDTTAKTATMPTLPVADHPVQAAEGLGHVAVVGDQTPLPSMAVIWLTVSS